jgi:hypothetical protein
MTKESPMTNPQSSLVLENHFIIRVLSFFRHFGLVISHSSTNGCMAAGHEV